MKYNFDEIIERQNTSCVKWDGIEDRFGTEDALPMWVADMDFKAPKPVIDALLHRVEHGIFGYTLRSAGYYEAIIHWLAKRHHFDVKREWIAHSPGVVPALSILVDTFTQPGDKIIIQLPVYHQFAHVINQRGRVAVNNPLQLQDGRYTMDFTDLESKLDSTVKMLILCNPHNPVGRVWTKEELMQLGEICMKHHILVISDEIHCDVVYNGFHHTPFASLSSEFANNSITCLAPSKTFNICGLQTSTLVIPNRQLRNQYLAGVNRLAIGLPNVFGAVALEAAYNHGEEWLNQLLQYLEENLRFLTQYLHEHIPQIKVIQPEGTYLVWLDCRELPTSGQKINEFLLKEAKVALDEGHAFGLGGEGFMRLNIACPKAVLEEGLHRIQAAISVIVQK